MSLIYPPFQVPGVDPRHNWQLFNTSNYEYYKKKIALLSQDPPSCPFCQIDTKINRELDFNNPSWLIWNNDVSPQLGQEYQFVIPSRRHVTEISELTGIEMGHLLELIQDVNKRYNIDGGFINVRSGNPLRNAKSVEHLHVNYLIPAGEESMKVTVAKSAQDLQEKLVILQIWEKMRGYELARRNPRSGLNDEEWNLVKDKLAPPKTKAKG